MINNIKWETGEVVVSATMEQVKDSPEYDPEKFSGEDFEAVLNHYYGRTPDGK